MIQAIERTKVDRLYELHKEIIGSVVKTIQAAIEAGGILTEIKGGLLHGEFTSWCGDNLPFDIRTAQRYMRCYALRDRLLKSDSVSYLSGAYRALEEPKEIRSKVRRRKITPFKWMESLMRHFADECDKDKGDKFFFFGMKAMMYSRLIDDVLQITDEILDRKIDLPVNFVTELGRRGWRDKEEAVNFLVKTVFDAVEESGREAAG